MKSVRQSAVVQVHDDPQGPVLHVTFKEEPVTCSVCSTLKLYAANGQAPLLAISPNEGTKAAMYRLQRGADEEVVDQRQHAAPLRPVVQSIPKIDKSVSAEDERFLSEVRSLIEQNISRADFTTRHLESALGMSHSGLYRKLNGLMGMTASKLILQIRLQKAGLLLTTTSGRVQEIAFAVGYNDPLYFSRVFRKATGLSPSKFRERLDCDVRSGGIKN